MGYFCFYRLCAKSDDAVNQTLIKTNTGIWSIEYNAEKRTTTFITCTYNFMDCLTTKKVETISTNPGDGERETIIILHQRFLYRVYLQIAACDLTSEGSPKLWHILWDPTQPVATRPLAIQQDDTWYCYGWDLTKNICELFQSDGSIGSTYAYAPFGEVTATGAVTQPFQWSSEYNDTELGMVYYNYRYYNPTDGRWEGRDPLKNRLSARFYGYVQNSPVHFTDRLGLRLFCCPDDTYSTAEEAARSAISTWNPISKLQNREHGGYICGCRAWFGIQDVVFYYTHTIGGIDGVDISEVECPWYDSTEADWHTHGGDDPRYHNEIFSPDDIEKSSDATGIPGYLGTPGDSFQRYDSATGEIESL